MQNEDENVEKSQRIQSELELWFQSALGRALLANQRPAIDRLISRLFGFHQVEIGVSHRIPVGNPSNLGHKFHLLPEWTPDLPENCVVANSGEIPLDHDIADLVILHHALDFSDDPHQLLREASRIIKSNGHLLIVGFNPISMWGLRKLFSRQRSAPWNNRYISGKRVEDWLYLLDFKTEGVRYHCYLPPFGNLSLASSFSWLENVLNSKVPLGAYYTILAQKQVGSRIKVSQQWRKKAKVVGMPIANRSERSNMSEDKLV